MYGVNICICSNPKYTLKQKGSCVYFRFYWFIFTWEVCSMIAKGVKINCLQPLKQKHWKTIPNLTQHIIWNCIDRFFIKFIYLFITNINPNSLAWYSSTFVLRGCDHFHPLSIQDKYNISMHHTLLILYWLKCNWYIALRPHTK